MPGERQTAPCSPWWQWYAWNLVTVSGSLAGYELHGYAVQAELVSQSVTAGEKSARGFADYSTGQSLAR